MYRSVKSSLLTLSAVLALVASVVSPSLARASVVCSTSDTVLYIVAHEDDALLFQNPDMQHDISAGKCVTTVFLSAGVAGESAAYWGGRETGAKAASAQMAGVPNSWTQIDPAIPGHTVAMFTLDGNTKVALAFLRIPSGNIDGNGFDTTGHVSLQKLWENNIPSISPVDGSPLYTRQDLIDTMLAFMVSTNPSRINTQDFIGNLGEGDHSDHYATAFFVKTAHESFTTPHTLYSYFEYMKWQNDVNVFGDDLTNNQNTFFTYSPFDNHVCQTIDACEGGYAEWLNRQYVNGSVEGGDACPNLEGRQATVPEGDQLVDGQCVPIEPVSCSADVTSSDVVSDTSDAVSSGGNAVLTYVPSTWTANIPGAAWIWSSFYVSDPTNGETITFTKQFGVTGTALAGSIVIASDDNYSASLNGTEFGSTTEENNFNEGNQDTYDVSSLLVTGANTLKISVRNASMNTEDPQANPAGLKYKLTLTKNSCVPVTPVTPPTGGGSSTFDYWGCTNKHASNFNTLANKDDGTCALPPGGTSGTTQGSVGGDAGTTTGEVLGASTTTPDLSLPAGCTEYIHSYMGKGKNNDATEVKLLQTFLNETMGSKIPVSGFFGTITKNWVKKFQAKYCGQPNSG